jgi:hypothetical protein
VAQPVSGITVLVNLGKNWLRSAMIISSGTFRAQLGRVHSHRCLEIDPAKNN